MDKRKKYASIVRQLLVDYAKIKPANGNIDRTLIFDDTRGNYELMNIGWDGAKRIHHSSIHIELKNDSRVWLQHNATNMDIAEELIEMGIPRDQIVLGSVLPQMRKFTKYGH
jgi:hypothetical protein